MKKFTKHVIVLGSARSGTSWLSETLAKPFRYRMLFEPEHDQQTKRGSLLTDKYFGHENPASQEAIQYLKQVFQNKVDCNWIAQNSNRKYKMHLWPLIPKKFIIKMVRFNLSGQFLYDMFQIPIVHIIRNPWEVMESQKRVNFPWLYDFTYLKQQKHLVELIKNEFNYDVTQIDQQSPTEKLIVRWCIENVIPLQVNTLPKEKYWVIKHEDLRADINVFKNLCNQLNFEILPTIEKEYKKPSTKTHPKSTIRGKIDQRSFINTEEEIRIKEILQQFKQELYPLSQCNSI